MRRSPAVVIVGLALFLTAACGTDTTDDDAADPPPATTPAAAGGTASAEEVCTAVEETFGTADADSEVALEAMREAAESGTEEELAQARDEYVGQAEAAGQELRDIAATAEDPELGAAVETLADALVTFVNQQAENPAAGAGDPSAIVAAVTEVDGYCG